MYNSRKSISHEAFCLRSLGKGLARSGHACMSRPVRAFMSRTLGSRHGCSTRPHTRTRSRTFAAATTALGAQSRNGADGRAESMAGSLLSCGAKKAYASGMEGCRSDQWREFQLQLISSHEKNS
mgnify:CR=1 FL=1